MSELPYAPEQGASDDATVADGTRSEGAAQEAEAAPKAPSLWRNRDYMYWWTGDAVSMLGSTLSEIAFPLLVLYSTGSAGQAGIVAAAQAVGRC